MAEEKIELVKEDPRFYEIKVKGEKVMALHFGREPRDAMEGKDDYLNISIQPKYYGSPFRVVDIRQTEYGTLYVRLEEEE
jgi:hypothetical protein